MTKQQLLTFAGMLKNSFDNRFALKGEVGGGITVKPRTVIQDNTTLTDELKAKIDAYMAGKQNVVINKQDVIYVYNKTVPMYKGVEQPTTNIDIGDNDILDIEYLDSKNWLFVYIHGSDLIKIIDLSNNSVVTTLSVTNHQSMKVTLDGKRLAIFDTSHSKIVLYELQPDNTYRLAENQPNIDSVKRGFSMNAIGDTIVTCYNDTFKVYKLNNGNFELAQTVVVSGGGSLLSATISKDGLEVYAINDSKKIFKYVLDTSTGNYAIEGSNLFQAPSDATTYYGERVALSLDKTVMYIGNFDNNSAGTEAGKVYVAYKDDNNTWSIDHELLPPNTHKQFGRGIAVNNENTKLWVCSFNATDTSVYAYTIEEQQAVADPESLDPLGDGSCIAYYKLNNDGSDAEGNYDTATINSGSYINGIHGKAVELSTGYISLPVSGISVDNITITMWVKVNTLSNAEVLGRNDSTRHCLYLNSDGHFNEFDASLQISQSEWVLIGYKQDSANSGAYLSINGSAWVYSSSAHKMISDTFILGYDHNNGNGGSYLDGAYDNVRIFNKSITDEEVQTIYNIEYKPNLTLDANTSYTDLQNAATLTNVPEAKYETVVDKGFSWFVSDGDIHKASIPFTQYGTYIKIVIFVDERVANAENFIDIYRIDDSSTPTTVYQVADSSVESEGIIIRKDGGNTVVASGENLYGQEFTFTGELINMQDNNLYIKFYCGDGNIVQPMYIKELSIGTKPFD